MKTYLLTGVALVLLTGCSSTGMPSMSSLTHRDAAPASPRETFAYRPATDANLRATVESVVFKGDPGYIPSDPNWLQVKLTLTNTGRNTVKFTDAKEQLRGGTVADAASDASQLLKPPSMVKTTAGIMGIGAAGTLVGAYLFPPAALLSGVAIVMGPSMMADHMEKIGEKLNAQALHPGPIAPGTSVSGYIFVPAVTGQTGLLTFYEVGGAMQSLTIQREQ